MDEEIRRAFDDLEKLMSFRFDSLDEKVDCLSDCIYGNSKPGLKDDLSKLGKEFDIHIAESKVIAKEKEKNLGNKFTLDIENTRFKKNAILTFIVFALTQILTLSCSVYNFVRNVH